MSAPSPPLLGTSLPEEPRIPWISHVLVCLSAVNGRHSYAGGVEWSLVLQSHGARLCQLRRGQDGSYVSAWKADRDNVPPLTGVRVKGDGSPKVEGQSVRGGPAGGRVP